MSLLPLVGTKVEVYSSAALWLTAEPIELNVKNEITEGLSTCRFTIKKTLPSNLPDIGHRVKVWIEREGTSAVQKFDGYVEKLSKKEEGTEMLVTCDCIELPVFAIRTTTVSKGDWVHDTLIKAIVNPLTVDGIITVTNVPTMGSTIRYEGVRNEPIFNALRRLAGKSPQFDFYLDYNKDLHAWYKEDTPASTEILDQTNPNATKILECEYAEDASRIRNTAFVIGERVKIEKDGNEDYFTESTTNWSGTYFATGVWGVGTLQTSTSYKTQGLYSIETYHDAGWGNEVIEAIRLTLSTTDLNIERLKYGGVLHFNLGGEVWKMPGPGSYFIPMDVLMGRLRLYVDVRDYKGTIGTYRDYINFWEVKEIEIPVGPGTEEIWKMPTAVEFDWSKLERIRITVWFKWTEEGVSKGFKATKAHLLIDKLHFHECATYASYAVPGSISKYGKRPYEKKIDGRGLSSDASCLEKLKSIIDPIAYPEKSLRAVQCEGNQFFEPGTLIYVNTDLVKGSYYIKTVEDNITEEFEYTTRLELSSSLVYPPTKTREILEMEKAGDIRRLEKKLEEIENKIRILKQPGIGPGVTLTSACQIDWESAGFDWGSLTAGIGELAADVVGQMFTNWAKFSDALGAWSGTDLVNFIENWAKIIDNLGSWSYSQIASVLTSWATIANSLALGTTTFSTIIYATASNFMSALSDVTNFAEWVSKFWGGKKAFTDIIGGLSATASNFMSALYDVASFADWVSKFWGGVKKFSDIIGGTAATVADLFSVIYDRSAWDFVNDIAAISWSTFYSWLTTAPSALTSAGAIATGAINLVDQIIDNLISWAKVDEWFGWFGLTQPRPTIPSFEESAYYSKAGTGSISFYPISSIAIDLDAGEDIELMTYASEVPYDEPVIQKFRFICFPSTSDVSIKVYVGDPDVGSSFGFIFYNGYIYAWRASETVGASTVIQSYSAGVYYLLEARLYPGTKIEYWINNVKKLTVTSALPNDSMIFLRIWAKNYSTGIRRARVRGYDVASGWTP